MHCLSLRGGMSSQVRESCPERCSEGARAGGQFSPGERVVREIELRAFTQVYGALVLFFYEQREY